MTKSPKEKNHPQLLKLIDGDYTIVDSDMYDFLRSYKWTKIRWRTCWYVRLVAPHKDPHKSIYLHRIIANTPRGQVCHHRNRNTMDNSRSNLRNMEPKIHEMLHRNDTAIIKFTKASTPASPAP